MLDEFGIKIFWLVIATIFGWVAHELSRYYFLQRTIRAYLLIVIPSLIKESRVSLDQMESYFVNKVDIGKAINIAPTYSNEGRLDLIACVKIEVIKILSRDEVKKFTHFYIALYEINSLLKGFSDHLVKYDQKKEAIDKATHKHLQTHIDRARKIIDQFPDESDFTSLNDLPKNFHFLSTL